MGRLLLILGIPVMIIGILGMTLGPFLNGGVFGSSSKSVINTATNLDQTAATFCSEGETLVTEQGPSVRTGTSTTSTGHTVLYYCESANGERRNVTQQANNTLISGVGDVLSDLGSFMPFRLEFVGAFVIGLIMTILGGTMMRRSMVKRLLESGGVASVQWDVNQMTPRVVISQRSQTLRHDSAQSLIDQINQAVSRSSQTTGADLTTRLEQVEQAYQKRLISQEEYDHLRKEILDTLS